MVVSIQKYVLDLGARLDPAEQVREPGHLPLTLQFETVQWRCGRKLQQVGLKKL